MRVLKHLAGAHRAVEPLPEAQPTDELLDVLELELTKARVIARILADRAKRAESRVDMQGTNPPEVDSDNRS